MSDWRSEPPDSPGWWLYRRDDPPRPIVVESVERNGAWMMLVSVAEDGPPYLCAPFSTGQWLKVPE